MLSQSISQDQRIRDKQKKEDLEKKIKEESKVLVQEIKQIKAAETLIGRYS